MTYKANPDCAIFLNFDPESGDLTKPGWTDKEVIFVQIVDSLEELLLTPKDGFRLMIEQEGGYTHFLFGGELVSSYEGNMLDELDGHDFTAHHLRINLEDKGKYVNEADAILENRIGDFDVTDSPLGDWFEPSKRSWILMEEAKEKFKDSGWHNNLVSLLEEPWMTDILQMDKKMPMLGLTHPVEGAKKKQATIKKAD